LVQLTSPNGLIGLGEASPISRYKESIDSVETFLQRIDPTKLSLDQIPQSMEYLETLSSHDKSAKTAIEMALLDAAAKQAQKSVHDYLGLGFRNDHHITSFTIGLDKPEIIREKVLTADRFPILKIKVGVPGDKENWQALRDVAPKKLVRLDANEGWKTKEAALAMIEWFAKDFHVQFVEQPLPASAPVEDWLWFKQRSPLPVFADESFHNAADAARCAECFHGVNVKLSKTGGLVAALAALKAAKNLGLKTMIGCMVETSLSISAAAHLAEFCDYLDLDGNLLITNDPFNGVTVMNGILSFADAQEKYGLRVSLR
jgi:L-alanine-DL-glutamate epimerase-like enolase superfamily enzyme